MAFETMTTASMGTGYVPSEDTKRTGNIQYLYDRRVEVLDVVTAETTGTTPGASAQLYAYTVPGSTLGTDGLLELNAHVTWTKDATNTALQLWVSYGGSSIGTLDTGNGAGAGSGFYFVHAFVKGRASTTEQYGVSEMHGYNIPIGTAFTTAKSASIPADSSASQALALSGCMLGAAGTMSMTLNYAKLEYYAAR